MDTFVSLCSKNGKQWQIGHKWSILVASMRHVLAAGHFRSMLCSLLVLKCTTQEHCDSSRVASEKVAQLCLVTEAKSVSLNLKAPSHLSWKVARCSSESVPRYPILQSEWSDFLSWRQFCRLKSSCLNSDSISSTKMFQFSTHVMFLSSRSYSVIGFFVRNKMCQNCCCTQQNCVLRLSSLWNYNIIVSLMTKPALREHPDLQGSRRVNLITSK